MAKRVEKSQVSVYSELFPYVPSKSQRRIVQIIEAAIETYIKVGVDNATYDNIAKKCGVSRPLVQHYFKDKEELFEMVVKYIRVSYQQYTIRHFVDKKDPRQRLAAYVDSAVSWIEEVPNHQKVWNLFYYYCGVNPKLHKLNTELVTMGHERITALLLDGAEKGVFPSDQLRRRAKQIQVLITGAIVTGTTESLYVDPVEFRRSIVEGCLRLAVAVGDGV